MRRLTALVAAAAVIPLVSLVSAGPVGALQTDFRSVGVEEGDLSRFDNVETRGGGVTVATDRTYGGDYAAKASYYGGALPGHARLGFDVQWQDGDVAWYGAAFYLPPGFKSGLLGGPVDILRWDNASAYGALSDSGGIQIGADGKGRVFRRGSGLPLAEGVTSPFDVPEGRWFFLEVHQHLSEKANALNQVFVDDRQVAASTNPNSFGRPITGLSYGLAGISQLSSAQLWVDRMMTSASESEVEVDTATLDTGSFGEFNNTNISRGSLTLSADEFRGVASAKATIHPSATAGNGFARGIFDVSWPEGSEVWYSAAFYLPPGFYDAQQGYVSIMRWDSYLPDGRAHENGGIAIYGHDKRARLVGHSLYGGEATTLVGPWDIPEGRWVQLTVHQVLASDGKAMSEVYQDGVLVGRSTLPNTLGQTLTRVRYGIVAIDDVNQRNGLTVYFDQARATSTAPPFCEATLQSIWTCPG